MTAKQECFDRIHLAIREAVDILDYATANGGLTTPAELADCAADQLCEYTVYLTPDEFDEVYAEITRTVYAGLGLDERASDGTDITDAMRVQLWSAVNRG